MVVWSALREALRPDEGFACLHFPIFPAGESWRYEPDILLLHRQLGLVVIEVKDCRAGQVEALEGPTWRMRDWRGPTEAPYEQAQRQMWALLKHFQPDLGDRLRGTALVALPKVPEPEWVERGFDKLPSNPGILHQEQLTPAKLRKRLYALTRGDTRPLMGDADWALACEVLGLRPVLAQMRDPRPALGGAATLSRIRASEAAIPKLDLEQLRIGLEVPPGPQRIRGIAGSGKTLLLAMKAARMHLSHPEWNIAFTFYTKSLYQVVRQHITRFCRFFGDRDPDWSKLQVLHGWGGQAETGLYRECALAAGRPPRGFTWAKAQLGGREGDPLAVCCEELLATNRVRPRFDAILIDEGQDFMPAFFQLARAALKPPHRLIWAYDEAQSLDHLHLPNAETLFGRDEAGRLRVDLAGQYPGGIWKSRIMRKCYRTPARILMPAHAFGMGLLRPRGPVQLITTKAGWEDIGYRVESGSFEAAGREVVITRPPEHCPHPLDNDLSVQWIVTSKLGGRHAELEGCATEIAALMAQGVSPDEILVVALGPSYGGDLDTLAFRLSNRGVEAHVANEQNASRFRRPGAVTLSGIHRAKGHEAPFVFVLRLDQLARREDQVGARNELFVALTRSRGLCRLTGTVPTAAALFAELEQVLEAGNRLAFPTVDPRKLRRSLGEEPEPSRIAPFVRHLPLYDLPAAATSPWLPARLPDPDDGEWIDASGFGKLDERMFAIRVRGDSMAPRIQDGTIAVFRRAEGALPVGDIVLASVGSLEDVGVSLVIKRLAKETSPEPAFSLVSDNPAYQPIVVTEADGVRVEGIFRGLVPG